MHPETIAQIILESIKLARVVIEGIPVEQRQKHWTEHELRLEKLQLFLDRLSKGLVDLGPSAPLPKPPTG